MPLEIFAIFVRQMPTINQPANDYVDKVRKLYTKKDVFSIGYDEDEGKLSTYNYNKFASESRILSFVAIISYSKPLERACLNNLARIS